VICPHCRTSLLGRDRGGNKCRVCKHRFAFDPKSNPLKLHDLRLRALVQTLSTKGREAQPPLAYTADQLRYAASRKVISARPGCSTTLGCMSLVPVVIALVAVAAAMQNDATASAASVAIAGLVTVVIVIAYRVGARRRKFPGYPVSRARFAAMLQSWQRVYGAPPAGMLPEAPAGVVVPEQAPRAVLFCPDGATVRFLAAAGVAQRHPVVLVPGPDVETAGPPPALLQAARDGLPVLVLHDAGVGGCVWVPRLRAALSGASVLDIGLRPRIATRGGPAVRLRPPKDVLEELRVAADRGLVELDADELTWLSDGNVLPLAAVLPARLLRAVERAVARAVDRPDPHQRRARELGFLTDPEAAA
jgi:hypothetical protein